MNDISQKKKYKNNFLKQVIYRVDFAQQADIDESTIKKYKESLSDQYNPLSEIAQKGIILQGHGDVIDTVADDHSLWRIETKDDSHRIEIDRSSFTITFVEYTRFSEAYTYIEEAYNKFIEQFTEITDITRLGLRYINEIGFASSEFTKWSDYLDDCLTKHFEFYEDRDVLRRSMHGDVIAHDEDTMINFNYGIYNKYFPAKIVENNFILDIDAYSTFALKKQDCLDMLRKYNKAIAIYFEQSIKEKLREEMEILDD